MSRLLVRHTRDLTERVTLFDRSEALTALEKIVDWCPEPVPTLDLGQIDAENKRGVRSLGAAIADDILTLLTAGELPLHLAERIDVHSINSTT